MAEPGGNNMLYGVVICDALDDPKTTLDDLTALRDRARAELDAQGDLKGALGKLEAEIGRRGSY
jgi:hypothetical protein